MRNPLRNLVRRPADKPTLKQRAAALKATAARVLRRPSPPASALALGSPEAVAAFHSACSEFDRRTRISDAEYERLRIGGSLILWTSERVRDALDGRITSSGLSRGDLQDLLVITLRRDLTMQEALRDLRLNELFARAYPGEADRLEEAPAHDGSGADPRLVALVERCLDARRALNDPAIPDGPEADALGETETRLLLEILRFPSQSAHDLAAKLPFLREEAEDAGRGWDTRRGVPFEASVPGAAWAGLLRDIEHLAGVPAVVAASHEPDPIFAAIPASRAAQAAMEEWVAQTNATPTGPDFAEEDRLNKAQYEAHDAVIATVPTTAAGRLALLEYLRWQMRLHGMTDGEPPESSSPFWRDAYKALKAALTFDGPANDLPASEPDPVLGLIEGHRAAFAEWDRLSRRWNETPSNTLEFRRLAEACKEPSEREMTLFGALLHARPTTLGGVLALADYLPGAIQQVCPDNEVTDGEVALKSLADALRPLAASSVAATLAGHPLVNQLLAVWRDYAPYVVAMDLPPEVEADFECVSEQRSQVIEAAERLPATMESVVPKALALAMIYGVELLHTGRSRKLYSGDGRLCFDLHLAVTGQSPAEV